MTDTDATLIERAKRGDREAFGMLYQRYVDPIYRYVRTRVSDDRDAEDITETVFLRSFRLLNAYEERGNPYSAYLYQVARTQLVEHYRRPEPAVSLEEAAHSREPAADPERQLELSEELGLIKQAMDVLPEDYQEVIRLRLLLSLPTKTAATWLGRSQGATRVLLHRALKALRAELSEDNDAE
jgi:RNA polymerase sigma-70 factor (ECF subfamily)